MLFREAIQEETGAEGHKASDVVLGPLFQPNVSVVPRVVEGSLLYAQSMVEAHRNLYPDSKAEYVRRCGGVLMFVSPSSPLTQMISFGITQAVTAADVAFARNFFAERGAVLRMRTTPFSHPSLLNATAGIPFQYEGAGFQIYRTLDENYVPAPSPIETRFIESVEDWSELFSAAYFGGDRIGDIEELARTIYHSPRTKVLGAWIDGKLIGGATVSFQNGLASLNGACTLSEYRRRGVQTALIRRRLQMASENGCTLAMSSVGPATESLRNHQREGFSVAYVTTILREVK